jgi:hypothetical protein
MSIAVPYERIGVRFRFGRTIESIERQGGKVAAVRVRDASG